MTLETSQLLLFVLLHALLVLNSLWLTSWLGGWKTWAERGLDAFLYANALIVVSFFLLHFVSFVRVEGLIAVQAVAALLLFARARKRGWEVRGFFTWKPLRDLGWPSRVLCGAFVGWLVMYVYVCRYLVPVGTDALNYHLPLPAHWLKDGALTLVYGMFLDPQLSYTPIAGELFFAWWMAPFGNDVLVRFGQMPFLVGAMLAVYTLWRRWNLSPPLALACAGLLLLYRPFLREIVIPNNDIMLATWLLVFLCQWQRLDAGWQGWARCGLALGLLAGTKVLGLLFAAPCLVLLAATAFGQRKELHIARAAFALVAAALLVGGFTYLRNWFLTGNPFYPALVKLGGFTVFDGMMDSDAMAATNQNWQTLKSFLFTRGTFGMGTKTAWIWAATALAAPLGWLAGRRNGAQPLWIWFALVAGYTIVVWKTPFQDERYLFPVYGVGLIFLGWWISLLDRERRRWIAALVLGVVAICFGSESILKGTGVPGLVAIAACIAALELAMFVTADLTRRANRYVCLGLIVAGVFAVLYLWPSFTRTYQEIKFLRFPHIYPSQGPTWVWIDQQTRKEGARIAYAGSPLSYPLFGGDLQNDVGYVPVQKQESRAWHDLEWPADVEMRSHAEIHRVALEAARGRPDFDAWAGRILQRGCRFLVVIPDVDKDPVEARWAREHPELFRKAFENGPVTVYEVAQLIEPPPSSR